MRSNGLAGVGLVLVLAAMATASCDTSRDFDTELAAARSQWTAQLAALQTRQTEYAARLESARAKGVGSSINAKAMSRRLEVMSIRAQQSLTEGNGFIDEVVSGIKGAKVPQDALIEGRVRMAEYFASQETALADAQDRLAQRLAIVRSEGEER